MAGIQSENPVVRAVLIRLEWNRLYRNSLLTAYNRRQIPGERTSQYPAATLICSEQEFSLNELGAIWEFPHRH